MIKYFLVIIPICHSDYSTNVYAGGPRLDYDERYEEEGDQNVGLMVMMLDLLRNMIRIELMNVTTFQEISTMHLGDMDVLIQD